MAEEMLNFEDRLRQRIGRPSRVESVAIRFTKQELAALEKVAQAKKTTLREWARDALLREASDSRTGALFTEVVATRMLLNLVLKSIACGEVMTAEVFSNILTNVRTTKHQAATDVMEQYAAAGQKERS
jgi:urate oxidase